jgi:hypothetical protein
MDNATRKLIVNAALVAIAKDDGAVERGGSEYWDSNGVHYSDDLVEIFYNVATGAMEIEKRENRNPVVNLSGVQSQFGTVMVFGQCIRTHGESQDIEEHVAKLAAELGE